MYGCPQLCPHYHPGRPGRSGTNWPARLHPPSASGNSLPGAAAVPPSKTPYATIAIASRSPRPPSAVSKWRTWSPCELATAGATFTLVTASTASATRQNYGSPRGSLKDRQLAAGRSPRMGNSRNYVFDFGHQLRALLARPSRLVKWPWTPTAIVKQSLSTSLFCFRSALSVLPTTDAIVFFTTFTGPTGGGLAGPAAHPEPCTSLLNSRPHQAKIGCCPSPPPSACGATPSPPQPQHAWLVPGPVYHPRSSPPDSSRHPDRARRPRSVPPHLPRHGSQALWPAPDPLHRVHTGSLTPAVSFGHSTAPHVDARPLPLTPASRWTWPGHPRPTLARPLARKRAPGPSRSTRAHRPLLAHHLTALAHRDAPARALPSPHSPPARLTAPPQVLCTHKGAHQPLWSPHPQHTLPEPHSFTRHPMVA